MKKNILSTAELSKYVHQEYKKLRKKAVINLIYRPLTTKFEVSSIGDLDGQYCYSDGERYHYNIMERGNIYKKVTTQDLFEITYLCMVEDISDMASLYELKHRNKNQDTRRLSFAKELELFEQIGEQYYKYHKDRIEDIINKNPYEDG